MNTRDDSNGDPIIRRPSGRHAIFVCDIVAFGGAERHDRVQKHLRTALYGALRKGFDQSGVPFGRCYHEDRGDGVIVVPPAETDLALLVHPLVDRLRAELRRHNELASRVATIRLRVALHVGEIGSDSEGIVGVAVNFVHRLLEAPRFKETFNASNAHVGFIVSAEVYDTVIRPGEGLIDPDEYAPVDVRLKETDTTAWTRFLGTARAAEHSPAQEIEPRRTDVAVPSAEGTSSPTIAPPGDEVSVLDLFEVVDRLLDIPAMRTPDGRDEVVGLLRGEVAVRIPRRAQPKMDMYSILRTCMDFPGGLAELLTIIRALAGESAQLQALENTIQRLAARGR